MQPSGLVAKMSATADAILALQAKEHKNVYAVLTILFACLGSMTYGYSSAIIATTLGRE